MESTRAQKRGRPKRSWQRTIQEEGLAAGKTAAKGGGDNHPCQIWKCLEVCESGGAAGEETCIKPTYCAFLKSTLLSFQFTIKELEQDNNTAPEVYPLKEKLRNKMRQRKEDMFIWEETEMLKLDDKCFISTTKGFLAFYNQSLKHLEKWFDFPDTNYPYKIQFVITEKKEPTNSDFKDLVVHGFELENVYKHELHKEFYKITPTSALFLNNKSKQTLSVSDNGVKQFWWQKEDFQMLHDYSRLYYSFLRTTLTWTKFSQLCTATAEMNTKSSVNLIKSETAIEMK